MCVFVSGLLGSLAEFLLVVFLLVFVRVCFGLVLNSCWGFLRFRDEYLGLRAWGLGPWDIWSYLGFRALGLGIVSGCLTLWGGGGGGV